MKEEHNWLINGLEEKYCYEVDLEILGCEEWESQLMQEAIKWCESYPSTKKFARGPWVGYSIIRFSDEEIAIMFALRFGVNVAKRVFRPKQ